MVIHTDIYLTEFSYKSNFLISLHERACKFFTAVWGFEPATD